MGVLRLSDGARQSPAAAPVTFAGPEKNGVAADELGQEPLPISRPQRLPNPDSSRSPSDEDRDPRPNQIASRAVVAIGNPAFGSNDGFLNTTPQRWSVVHLQVNPTWLPGAGYGGAKITTTRCERYQVLDDRWS